MPPAEEEEEVLPPEEEVAEVEAGLTEEMDPSGQEFSLQLWLSLTNRNHKIGILTNYQRT